MQMFAALVRILLLEHICLGLLWRPILTPPQILLAATSLSALAAFTYWRTWNAHPWASVVLLMMRLAGLVALVVLLLGPSDTPATRVSSHRTHLTIAVDLSDSMLTEDCQGQTRLDVVRNSWLQEESFNVLSRSCTVRLFGFADRLRPISRHELTGTESPQMSSDRTNLADSLYALLSAQRPMQDAALLVLSDGHDTGDADLGPVGSLARSRGIPVYTVALGSENQQQDLVMLAVPKQDYLLPGESGAIVVKAYQFGLPQARTSLRVVHDDVQQEIPIAFNGRAEVELQLEVQAEQPGQYEYRISLEPVTGEVELKNNQQTVFCQIEDRRIRVIMLEGQPYWDTKFLAQSLRKDERIELTQITQVSDGKPETLVSRARSPLARPVNAGRMESV